MAFQKVGSIEDLPAGAVMEAMIGEKRIAICNAGGELHALEGTCPHRGGPLGQGALHETTLVCPWHAWEYDCITGQNTYNPAVQLPKYSVKVEAGDILVDLG